MIFSKKNLDKSVNRLLSKPNNCGVDGILVSEFADYWKLNKEKILSLLREGKYKPSAVLLEEMIFKKGKKGSLRNTHVQIESFKMFFAII